MWLRRAQPALRSWSVARAASTASRSSRGQPQQRNSPPSNRCPQNPTPQNNANTNDSSATPQAEPSKLDTLSNALRDASAQENTLLAPVHIPEDPNAVLKERHPAAGLLANSALVVQRQLEMMNIMIGFEQANRYVILDAQGNHVGYMAERDAGLRSTMGRQAFHTHRAFETHVFDRHQNEVLRFHRPFSWINSRIRVYDPLEVADTAHSSFTGLQPVSGTDVSTGTAIGTAKVSPLERSQMRVVGEAHQQWAPLRRKYNLFLFHSSPNAEKTGPESLPPSSANLSSSKQLQTTKDSEGQFNQFAAVNEPFLSWDFSLMSADSRLIGSVNRNFAGFGREIFTDTGVYALRMDAAALAEEKERRHLISQTHKTEAQDDTDKITPMTLDQRAVMLATAVSIDFDYFSRHSGSHGGIFPFPIFGGSAAGEGAAGGAAGEAAGGAVGTAAGEGASGAVTGAAAGEATEGVIGGAAAAGSMAGYEAMRRGSAESPASQEPPPQETPGQQAPVQDQEEVWGEDMDFWGRDGGGGPGGNGGAPPTGGEGGGGGGGWEWDDFF